MPGPIRRIGQSDLGNADVMRQISETANTGHVFSATGDMEAVATPSGRAMLHTRFERIFDRRWVKLLQNSGYTDARYLGLILTQRMSDDNISPSPFSAPTTAGNIQLIQDTISFPEGGTDGSQSADVGSMITLTNVAELFTGLMTSAGGTHNILEYPGDGGNTPVGTAQVGRPPVVVEAVLMFDRENPATPHWLFCLQPAPVVPVVCITDGGGNGTVSTAPSYTYTIYDYGSGTVIGGSPNRLNVHQTPKLNRTFGSVIPATFGYAHIGGRIYDGTNKYVLGWCNEAPSVTACST